MGEVGAPIERTDLTLAIAAQVRAERAARRLTQQQVLALSGLSESTYLRMESGERTANPELLARLCRVYGLRLSVFFARVEERLDEST